MNGNIMIPNRRLFLGAVAVGSATLLAGGVWAAWADDLARTPRQTEGPFYPNKLPLDTDNDLLIVNNSKTLAEGEITHLTGRVLDTNGSPIRNAAVEIWQVDAHGAYLHTGTDNDDKRDKNFQGFGRFTTASSGEYYFRTIKPVAYPGRTPHIHFKIKRNGKDILTTQCYVKGEARNDRDGILRSIRDAKARESLIVAFEPMAGSKRGELTAKFDIVLGVTPEDNG